MWYKRSFALFFSLLLLLFTTACQAIQDTSAIFSFPGTHWNMTPDEMIQALELSEEAYEISEHPYESDNESERGRCNIIIDDIDVFGASASVGFRFSDYTGNGIYGLHYITVLYPEGTDMVSVQNNMIEEYGTPVTLETTKYDAEYRAHVTKWVSESKLIDCLTQEQIKKLSEDDIEYLETHNLATIFWSDEVGRIIVGTNENWEQDPYGLTFFCGMTEVLQKTE